MKNSVTDTIEMTVAWVRVVPDRVIRTKPSDPAIIAPSINDLIHLFMLVSFC